MKRYRLAYQHYLRMEGTSPQSDPVLLDEGTEVGEGTAFPFQGSPTPGMIPLTPEAETAHEEYLETIGVSQPTLKDYKGPSEGGASPFDPSAPGRDSTAEKEAAAKQAKLEGENDELKKRIAELEKNADAKNDGAKPPAQAPKPAEASKPGASSTGTGKQN